MAVVSAVATDVFSAALRIAPMRRTYRSPSIIPVRGVVRRTSHTRTAHRDAEQVRTGSLSILTAPALPPPALPPPRLPCPAWHAEAMLIARSIALFAVAALFEIGGAWLVWQGVREHRGWIWIGAGVAALGVYGFVATLQPDADFGRILAAYGGVFVAGSIAWGMVADGYRPDRWDVTGALICLAGMAVIMYAPRDH